MEKKPKEADSEKTTEGTPFTEDLPVSRWQGKTCSILELPYKRTTTWVYFTFADPDSSDSLNVQTRNKSEAIFFNTTSHKYFRATDDSLSWSYYVNGPFQRFDSGVWITPQVVHKDSKSPPFKFISEKGNAYEMDVETGLLKSVESEEKQENKEKAEDKKEKKAVTTNAKALKENEKAWEESAELIEKLKKRKEMKVFQEAIKKGEDSEPPEIKSNEIMDMFEEILGVYDMSYEYNRDVLAGNIFPLENINDAKYVAAIIAPEVCLYPKSLFNSAGLKVISFAGEITSYGLRVGSASGHNKIYLNSKEKNIMKIQQGFHAAVLDSINSNEDAPGWCSLNPPDFSYDIVRKKIPKGLKGFISFEATLTSKQDAEAIFFALMKNPPTVLNHNDIIIAKKAHLLKNHLQTYYPNVITEEWWDRVTKYKDIMEIALETTEYFKEAHLDGCEQEEQEKQEK